MYLIYRISITVAAATATMFFQLFSEHKVRGCCFAIISLYLLNRFKRPKSNCIQSYFNGVVDNYNLLVPMYCQIDCCKYGM